MTNQKKTAEEVKRKVAQLKFDRDSFYVKVE